MSEEEFYNIKFISEYCRYCLKMLRFDYNIISTEQYKSMKGQVKKGNLRDPILFISKLKPNIEKGINEYTRKNHFIKFECNLELIGVKNNDKSY